MNLVLGEAVLDLERRTLHRGGEAVQLGRREAAILAVLARHSGEVVPRQTVIAEVWGPGDPVSTRTVDQVVRRLRQKVEPRPHDPQFLRTVYGRGYQLGGERATTGTLPAPVTRLVGRKTEQETLRAWMADPSPAVALIGPGGIGKTRLALHVAATSRGFFAEGAAYVPLHGVPTLDLVPAAIRNALGLPDTGGALQEALWTRPLLLVLDNLEHLLPELTGLLVELAAVPGPSMLLTSQVAPEVPGLVRVDLAGLPADDALALFEDRIAHATWGRTLSDNELPHAAGLCDLVYGSPLAIELAAARCRDRPVAEVHRAVADSMDALAVRFPDVAVRQRSLRAAFDYSWALLAADQRALLSRLVVFRGTFDADAAYAVAGAGSAALDRLVDRSLLGHGYAMHTAVRAFAAERNPPTPELLGRHARWYLGQVVAARPALNGPDQPEVAARLTACFDDVRTAWSHAADAHPDLVASALPAVADLLEITGRAIEGRAMLQRVLHHPDVGREAAAHAALWAYDGHDHATRPPEVAADASAREAALGWLARGAWFRMHGTAAVAVEAFQRSTDAARETGDVSLLTRALTQLGAQHARVSALPEADAALSEAIALATSLGDPNSIGTALLSRCWLHIWRTDFERAAQDIAAALEAFERAGNLVKMTVCLHVTSTIARVRAQWQEAAELHAEVVSLQRQVAPRGARLLYSLAKLAMCHARLGDAERSDALAREVLEIAGDGHPGVRRRILLQCAESHRWLGRPQQALEAYDAALALVSPGAALAFSSIAQEGRAAVLFDLGRTEQAAQSVQEALRLARADDPAWGIPRAAATAYRITGDAAYARMALEGAQGRGAELLGHVVACCGGVASADEEVLESQRRSLLDQLLHV